MDAEFELWRKDPSPKNAAALLQAASPVIDSALTSYAGGDRALSGRAKVLALKAFQTYNPKKGAKLNTHLMSQLQPLRRDYHNRANPLKIPERAMLEWRGVSEAEGVLKNELGRDPSDVELADRSGYSLKQIRRLRAYGQTGIPASYFDDTEGDDSAPDNAPSVSRPDPQKIWMDYVHHDLGPIDQKILEWKTGVFGHQALSTNEIARRLKLSPGAVSQRASKIAAKLAEAQELGDVL